MHASDFRAQARRALQNNWGRAVGVYLLYVLICIVVAFAFGYYHLSQAFWQLAFSPDQIPPQLSVAMLLINLGILLVSVPLSIGIYVFFLRLHRRQDAPVPTLFCFMPRWFKAVGLYLLQYVFTMLWALLFIIPGIVKAYSYAMAPFIMADDPSVSPLEAITRSRKMMQGNKFRLFCLEFSFIGWALLCSLTMGIGFIWVMPYMMSAHAAFYLEVSGQNQAAQADPAV